jgi:hypothetical protein
MRSADHITATGDGTIVEQGSFDRLDLMEGYLSSISQHENRAEASPKEDIVPLIPTNALKLRPKPKRPQADEKRQTGDLTVYKYYCSSAGWLNIAFAISTDVASAFCVVFSSECFVRM